MRAGIVYRASSSGEVSYLKVPCLSGAFKDSASTACVASCQSGYYGNLTTGACQAFTVKTGFTLVPGNDLTGTTMPVSKATAEQLCQSNQGQVMGYTCLNSDPDQCWVKLKGTVIAVDAAWTTMLL